MELDGKWVVLVGDEPYEAGHNQVLEIDSTEARSNRGTVGTVRSESGQLRIDVTPTERLVVAATAAGDMAGVVYGSYSPLPPSDPIATGREDEDVEQGWWCHSVFLIREHVAADRFKDGPSRYSSIDVSMYDLNTIREAGFFDTTNDDEVEAALRKLPLAEVIWNQPQPD